MGMRWINPINVGDVYENRHRTKVKVIKVESARKIFFVCLDDYGFEGRCTAEHIRLGAFSNPYDKTLCGIGFIGDGNHKTSSNGIKNPAHIAWHSMINRCYGGNCGESYQQVKVCVEWHNFQNFAEWWADNCPKEGSWELDKDILCDSVNKIYSPESCCFIPKSLNSRVIKLDCLQRDGGIIYESGKFYTYRKSFITFYDAKRFYLEQRKQSILFVIKEFDIDSRILIKLEEKFNEAFRELECYKPQGSILKLQEQREIR